MKLRPHQELAIAMCRESISRGNRRIMLAAPCSFGKTITAIQMMVSAVERGKRVVFICDRIKLVEQTLASLDKMGIDCGVMQGDHWRTDYRKPIQVASSQTLTRRLEKYGSRLFDFDLAIVDEAHCVYKAIGSLMLRFTGIVWVGLSATPYSRGLGNFYQDLIVPITPEELLEQGYLCPVKYYAGHKVDTKGMRVQKLNTGAYDFNPHDLAKATENDTKLTGHIIENWLKYAEGRQTIAFTPSIKHSKDLVEQFNAAGIPAAHISGYTDLEERQILYDAHDAGEFKILSCSQLLSVGYDSPSTSCIIDCRPTKSLITYVQTAGRIMRTHLGKEEAIYLDHAGNTRHGFAESIVPESLDMGEKKYSERDQVKEKKEPTTSTCPECFQVMVGVKCQACGYEIPITKQLESDDKILQEVKKKENKTVTKEQKCIFYAELLLYARTRQFKDGWASNKYRERFGVWPNHVRGHEVKDISDATMGWIKHQQIKWAKRRTA